MTVGELIRELSKHPYEMDVLNYEGFDICTVEEETLHNTGETVVIVN